MYTVYAFPDDHTMYEIPNIIEAKSLCDELARDYLAAYISDEDGNVVYTAERSFEFPWEM